MIMINPAAKAAQDAARHRDGKFGPQVREDNDDVQLAAGTTEGGAFTHDGAEGATFTAVRFGDPWNGFAAPVVDKANMDAIVQALDGHWDGDRAVFGNEDAFEPSADGTYDLGDAGWTFARADGRDHPDFGKLTHQVDFDHAFGIDKTGTHVELPRDHPDAQTYFESIEHINDPEGPNGERWDGVPEGWEVVTGFTGQYGYDGGLVHPSEFPGGGMEAHVRENPGLYALVHPYDGDAPDQDDPDYDEDTYDPFVDGWALLHKTTDDE